MSATKTQNNHISGLSANSEILLSHVLLCCDTQFGRITAHTTADPVLKHSAQKVDGNQAKKYPKRMRSRGGMAAGKSSNPKKKSKNSRFSRKYHKIQNNYQVIKKSKSQYTREIVDFFSPREKISKSRLFLEGRKISRN